MAETSPLQIGILGAGHAGITLFSCLRAFQGPRAKLYSYPGHCEVIKPILQAGVIELRMPRQPPRMIAIGREDLAESPESLICSSDVIINTTPIGAHDAVFGSICVYAHTKPRTLFNIGGGFSIFSHILHKPPASHLALGTAHTLPFACRVEGTTAHLLNVRRHTLVSFDESEGTGVVPILENVFGAKLETDASILHASIDRSSYVMHPLLTLLNATRIDRAESFSLYKDGLTESAIQLLIAAGNERAELASALGYFDFPSPLERLERFQRTYGEDFKCIRPPSSLNHRYMTEDVPYGLVPLCGLGDALGVPMPVCRALVDLCSAAAGRRFWDSPYNLASNSELLDIFLKHK